MPLARLVCSLVSRPSLNNLAALRRYGLIRTRCRYSNRKRKDNGLLQRALPLSLPRYAASVCTVHVVCITCANYRCGLEALCCPMQMRQQYSGVAAAAVGRLVLIAPRLFTLYRFAKYPSRFRVRSLLEVLNCPSPPPPRINIAYLGGWQMGSVTPRQMYDMFQKAVKLSS